MRPRPASMPRAFPHPPKLGQGRNGNQMINRDVALEFLRCFCAGNVDGLAPLLAEDFQFNGPLFEFGSKDAYLDSLKVDPLERCSHRILSVTEGADSVSIYYDYEKRNVTITIAQLFTFKDGQISELLLVFDGRGIG